MNRLLVTNMIKQASAQADDMERNGFNYGYQLYHLFKAAQDGDPAAMAAVDDAAGQAAADAAAVESATAPEGDGSQPGTIGPNGMMACPNCGTQMTPSLDMKCPACGYDVTEILAGAAGGQPPAAGGGMPSEEEVATVANEVKAAALQDPDFLEKLIQHYGHLVG
jgi:hypothetical protein